MPPALRRQEDGWVQKEKEKKQREKGRELHAGAHPTLYIPPFLPLNPLYTDVLYISIDPGAELGRHSARGQPTLPPPPHLLPVVVFGIGRHPTDTRQNKENWPAYSTAIKSMAVGSIWLSLVLVAV